MSLPAAGEGAVLRVRAVPVEDDGDPAAIDPVLAHTEDGENNKIIVNLPAGEAHTIKLNILVDDLAGPVESAGGQVYFVGEATGGDAGTVAFVPGSTDVATQRPDFLFFGVSGPIIQPVEDVPEWGAITIGATNQAQTVPCPDTCDNGTYIFETSLDVSADALGTFHVAFQATGANDTFLIDDVSPPSAYPLELWDLEIAVAEPLPAPEIVHATTSDAMTAPCSGYVDPHTQFLAAPVGSGPGGITDAFVKFNVDVFKDESGTDAECAGPQCIINYPMTETGGAAAPRVDLVEYVDGDKSLLHVVWNRPLTLQEWTTLRFIVFNAEGTPIKNVGDLGDPCNFPPGAPCNQATVFDPAFTEPDRIDMARLPADIDQNRVVQALDLLRFRQFVFDTCPPNGCPECGGDPLFFNIDQDPADQIGGLDLLRFRQNILGTPPAADMAWSGVSTNAPRP